MKGKWATEKGSQRTGVEMKLDAQGQRCTRIFSVTKDLRRRLRTKVAIYGSEEKIKDKGIKLLSAPSCERQRRRRFRLMAARTQHPIHGAHANRKRGDSFLPDVKLTNASKFYATATLVSVL